MPVFTDLQKTIASEYSGLRAKDWVAKIAQFHRIQASPGFRAAAQLVHQYLLAIGVEAELSSFPAEEGAAFWGCPSFQEWEANAASLHLVAPADRAQKLADYHEIPISLVQRSTPVSDLEADVVLLEDGEEETDYQGLDLTGKIVLTRGEVERVRQLAVGKFGAVGILFDGMRESLPIRQRIDLPDARPYTSFWWRPGEPHCFGFVLSPRQGDDLRALIKNQLREGKAPPRVRAQVDSRLYNGLLEVVSGLIPGHSDEEVVIVAHLCHPQPSANDNASGAAALVELARSLQQLIVSGKLPRPRRSIRLLWVPEMTGTYAYLSAHEDRLPRMIAGLNLDMVGQDQQQCGSVFVIERPPESAPSFAADLLERLLGAWTATSENPAGSPGHPLFRHTVSPFSGGSDHCVLSDPTVGVPAPMLIQWPDKFYHTSSDTLDKVDAAMLSLAGELAACYAFFVANSDAREVTWLGYEMNARFRARLTLAVQDALTDANQTHDSQELSQAFQRLDKRIRFAAERQGVALLSLLRLEPTLEAFVLRLSAEVKALADEEVRRARAALESMAQQLGLHGFPASVPPILDPSAVEARQVIPVRLFRGPASVHDRLHKLPQPEQDRARRFLRASRPQLHGMVAAADYWADGQRTVAAIAELVELETRQSDLPFLMRYYQLAEQVGLVALRRIDLPSVSIPLVER